MPGSLIHQGALVICIHAGTAQPAMADVRVKVGGQPVVTQASQYLVSGCSLASSGSSPCVTAQWVSAATRVLAGGIPVLLQDSQAICAPTGTGLNIISAQTRVRGL